MNSLPDTRFKKYQKHGGLDYICTNFKKNKLATKLSCSCTQRINYCDTMMPTWLLIKCVWIQIDLRQDNSARSIKTWPYRLIAGRHWHLSAAKPQVVFPHQYVFFLVVFLATFWSLCWAVPAERHKIALITLEFDMLGFAKVMEDWKWKAIKISGDLLGLP